MRFGELASRVFALAIAMGLGASTAMSGTNSEGPSVPLSERVFFDRGALSPELQAAVYVAGLDDPQIVPLPTEGLAEPHLPTKRDRGAAIVVAALAPSKIGTLTDIGLHSGPWIVPAVPPLLSKPSARSTPREDKLPVLEDPSVGALVHVLAARPANRPARVLGGRKSVSKPGRSATSKLPSAPPMSGRWTDPLAWPDEDEAKGEAAAEFILPFANGRVTSLFNQGRRHPAIDLGGALGSPVLATTSQQTVVFAGGRGGYGNTVIARDALGRTHLYAHLQRVNARVGQVLGQGEKLGHLGSTGFSTGPHVHYEVKDRRGQHIDPVTLLFPGQVVRRGYAWLDVRQAQQPAKAATLAAQPRPR
jgi:murein DD-endopeptidase MepM/ murein hydrolase activator NlpD